MNAVEIEQAVSALVEAPFDPVEFPFAFLAAFGHKDNALKRLRTGNTNTSDLPGGLLLRNHIHMVVAGPGHVATALAALRGSPANAKAKPKFLLATDGEVLEAEDLTSGETLACAYPDLPNHFGFLLPLGGISTVKEIKDNPIDVRATSRLNKLYVTLLADNPDWATDARRADMNHFMARLIFCFFAEDTGIFEGESLFTTTLTNVTERDGGNVHEVLSEIFRAMDVPRVERPEAQPRLPGWAVTFPYVNGALFSGSTETPRFSRMARTYLLHAGTLDWKAINPDIFGSMIQAVADDEERGALGMHYTSVPNILKVLNPLFLDDLRAHLDTAGHDKRRLLALRRRISRIRVFDPACGSGNFLVIAYKHLRAIEAEINDRRGERDRKSEIPLTNFRGIELRNFPAEIARLALIIAEFQSDELYRGQREAIQDFLPLSKENWIVCGNALRLDWLAICPPTGTGVKLVADDLFETPLDQTEIDFENEGGETYICGNPPYKGRNRQSESEKHDAAQVFARYKGSFAALDYVASWFIKAALYLTQTNGAAALVSTNSVCQGEQVALLWPLIFELGLRIHFAHTSFEWSNLAANKAGVTVVVVGIGPNAATQCRLYSEGEVREVACIGPYLVANSAVYVSARSEPIADVAKMYLGNMAKDGGHLIFAKDEARILIDESGVDPSLIRDFYGSEELIHAKPRACLWIEDEKLASAEANPAVASRLRRVRESRLNEKAAPSTRAHAKTPHRFVQLSAKTGRRAIVVPRVSSERRPYLPVDYFDSGPIVGDKCYALYDEPLWNLALVASKLHIVWIGTVCSRLRSDYSYGNKLGWNTFPVPLLTEENKADLTRCAEDILLAREAHFPKTIAELYDPEGMPDNLRHAHDRNDEVLERIYIGRRFKNDTERLEKLFDLYTKMTVEGARKPAAKKVTRRSKA